MATKELIWNSKVKLLRGFVTQLTSPSQFPPSGTDLTNTLKFFNNQLLGMLKNSSDMSIITDEWFYRVQSARSNMRLALFPTLGYSSLCVVLLDLLPVVHLVNNNQQVLMESLLQLISCLTPFLSWDELVRLPYPVALMLPTAHPDNYADIIHVLCVYLFPNVLGRSAGDNIVAREAISGILMLILQHCQTAHLHSRVIETLFPLKENLYKDLFIVIAYGPPNTKIPAATLLFHYWPRLQALHIPYKHINAKYEWEPWKLTKCQRIACINKSAGPAGTKICVHPGVSVTHCDVPPPAFLCVDCVDTDALTSYKDYFYDMQLPSIRISITCTTKECADIAKEAVAVCSSKDCIKSYHWKPVSLCQTCHETRHPGNCGFVQMSIENIWSMDNELRSYVVDAVVNLLREAEPVKKSAVDATLQPIMDNTMASFVPVREAINSRYGGLLIKELCQPTVQLETGSLGRLVGMLFHWFLCTGSTCEAVTSDVLEKVKMEHMVGWVHNVKKHSYEIILATLLPHPPDFAKVGGQWERLSGRTDQIKEGLQKLIMLGPYDIVSFEVWDNIMPYWLESIRTELTLKEREDVKSLLKRTFDVDMSPLPFVADKIYNFLFARFESADPYIQEQGLHWLQILSSVGVCVPFVTVLNSLIPGCDILIHNSDTESASDDRNDLDVKLSCFILMIDILLAQRVLSRMVPHATAQQAKSAQIFTLLTNMISCVRPIKHSSKCQSREEDCDVCKQLTIFYQLIYDMLVHICPCDEAPLPLVSINEYKALHVKESVQPNKVKDTPDGTEVNKEAPETPPLHGLFVSLLQVLETDKDIDVCYYILGSLKILAVHTRCMNVAYEVNSGSVERFLKQQCIPRLWEGLVCSQSRSSTISATILFHAIALGDGIKHFWSIVKRDCQHSNWKVRYAAVEKIRMIWESSSVDLLSVNMRVMAALAHVFCQYVKLIHDSNHSVAQRALSYLHLMGEKSLQAIILCMTAGFDTVLSDRHIILYKLSMLQNALPNRKVFSWPFFYDRLTQLAVEAKLVDRSTDSTFNVESMLNMDSAEQKLDLEQVVKKAQFAMSKFDSVSSIKYHSGVCSVQTTESMTSTSKEKRLGGATHLLKQRGKKKTSTQSESSIQDWLMLAQGGLQDLSNLHHLLGRSRKEEITADTSNISGKRIQVFWKAMKSEKLDHGLLHQLVEIIVKYMSTPASKEESADEQYTTYQRYSLEYVFYFLGYAKGEFFVKPSQMRSSPVLDALLCNLPQFLDSNVEFGTKILVDCLNMLKFCPSPQKYASDNQAADYSLALVPPHLTKYWVQSLLIILYKYNYSNNAELSPAIHYLVQIVLNTLSAIPHSCEHKARDTDSITEVQGIIQGTNDKNLPHSSSEDNGAQSPRSSPPEPVRQKTTLGSLVGAYNTTSPAIPEEEELDPLGLPKLSSLGLTDSPSQSNNSYAAASGTPSMATQSPKQKLKKSKKKPKKLPRQANVDIDLPGKRERRLPHWRTVDSSKSEEISMSSLGRSQTSSSPSLTSEKPNLPQNESTKFAGNAQDSLSSATNGESKKGGAEFMSQRSRRGQNFAAKSDNQGGSSSHTQQTSSSCSSTSIVKARTCPDCMIPLDSHSEETIGLCIVAVETYLNHNLTEAASMVYEMILSVSRVANTQIYSWQNASRPVFIPGNVTSSALQFLRCSLHHLNPYNIMSALLLSSEDSSMFSAIVPALTDFPELSSVQALLSALEGINGKSEIKKALLLTENLTVYLSSMTTDLTNSQEWPKIVDQLEMLFRKLTSFLPEHQTNLTSLINLMMAIFKLPIIVTHKGDRLVETFGKLLSVALQSHTFDMVPLAKLCQLCHRTFSKDRDKAILARVLVNELILVLKYKSTLPEANVLTLLEIVCLDCSSTLLPTYITNEIPAQLTSDMIIESGILEVMRVYLNDAIEFISDLHTLLKLKAHMKSTRLHEDTFGGLLKTGIAQIIALEMSSMIQGDPNAAQRIIPWLYAQQNFPQKGPKEFLEHIDHVRFLCWLYIGALTHHAVAENVFKTKCQPLPLNDASHISVMTTSIMTGFVQYSNSSVAFMSSLFYGFILCQVWTVYCETLISDYDSLESDKVIDIVLTFWSMVSPVILNMVSHSKVLREMITLHVLSMMETLQECQSSIVVKLSPMWRQLLFVHDSKLPTNILVRIQSLDNWQPSATRKANKAVLLDWIKKTQFRLAQIEVQSSTAVRFVAI